MDMRATCSAERTQGSGIAKRVADVLQDELATWKDWQLRPMAESVQTIMRNRDKR